MTTNNKQQQQKKIWNLIAGIAFLGFGSYRIYNHFYGEAISNDNFRLILAVAFVGFGLYRIFTYFNANK